jgi:hypothetical protein
MKSGMCILLCLAFIAGCGAPKLKHIDKNLEETWLSFIKDGETTKEEVILKYGTPVKTFTKENILIYIVRFDKTKGFVNDTIPSLHYYPTGNYHLVFVFDQHDILKKHSFLQTR